MKHAGFLLTGNPPLSSTPRGPSSLVVGSIAPWKGRAGPEFLPDHFALGGAGLPPTPGHSCAQLAAQSPVNVGGWL